MEHTTRPTAHVTTAHVTTTRSPGHVTANVPPLRLPPPILRYSAAVDPLEYHVNDDHVHVDGGDGDNVNDGYDDGNGDGGAVINSNGLSSDVLSSDVLNILSFLEEEKNTLNSTDTTCTALSRARLVGKRN